MLSKEVHFPLVSLLSLATESVHSQQNLSCVSHQFRRSLLFPVENRHHHGDLPQETWGISLLCIPQGKENNPGFTQTLCLFLCKSLLIYYTLPLTATLISGLSMFTFKQPLIS